MPWTPDRYPPAMQALPPDARAKAIDIANALLDRGYEDGSAIRIAIAAAKRWWWRRDGGALESVVARTAMKGLVALAALALVAGIAQGDESRAVHVMREHKCYVCHANDETLVGPGFAEVATAYRGDPDAAAKLATFIRRGASSGGPWHMPPHPEISAADAATIARYILSLDPEGRSSGSELCQLGRRHARAVERAADGGHGPDATGRNWKREADLLPKP